MTRPNRLRPALLGVALLLLTPLTRADEVLVAVAANFAGPMARIAEGFAASSGHTLRISSGATGKFYTQIVAGAPFDLLLAADDETPRRLVAEGHGLAGSLFTYAIGRLALWSAQPDLVDRQGAALGQAKFSHLAIANPKTAPYGQAAMDVLKARGLLDALAPKLVTGESIAQTYQFVVSGNAELGFVALSQISVPGKPIAGSFWLVPEGLHRRIRQDVVLLKGAASKPAAVALLAYLRTPAVREMIDAYGYGH